MSLPFSANFEEESDLVKTPHWGSQSSGPGFLVQGLFYICLTGIKKALTHNGQ